MLGAPNYGKEGKKGIGREERVGVVVMVGVMVGVGGDFINMLLIN